MTKGQRAYARLRQLAQEENLQATLAKLNYNPRAPNRTDPFNSTSCYQTMIAVAKTLSGQAIPANSPDASMIANVRPVTPVLARKLGDEIDADRLLTVSVTFAKGSGGGGDHHFAAFRLDNDTVVVAMGWQNIYDLTRWMNENWGGRFKRDRFDLLADALANNSINGLLPFCSYLGAAINGNSIPNALREEAEGLSVTSVTVYALDLPG